MLYYAILTHSSPECESLIMKMAHWSLMIFSTLRRVMTTILMPRDSIRLQRSNGTAVRVSTFVKIILAVLNIVSVLLESVLLALQTAGDPATLFKVKKPSTTDIRWWSRLSCPLSVSRRPHLSYYCIHQCRWMSFRCRLSMKMTPLVLPLPKVFLKYQTRARWLSNGIVHMSDSSESLVPLQPADLLQPLGQTVGPWHGDNVALAKEHFKEPAQWYLKHRYFVKLTPALPVNPKQSPFVVVCATSSQQNESSATFCFAVTQGTKSQPEGVFKIHAQIPETPTPAQKRRRTAKDSAPPLTPVNSITQPS
ncbi:hypothetical protein OF83DRAFT_1193471 [Amylostereum chailletii]|nr:hypothetical protein OF83DRAFT_1193471 [Amylostereum chailletii]